MADRGDKRPRKRTPGVARDWDVAYSAVRAPAPPPCQTISASEFKARCLALLEAVATTGEEIIVTKRGRPIAKLVPIERREPRSLKGSVTILTDNEEELFSTGEEWEVERALPDAPGFP